jgi:hypothetical protein
MKSINRYVVGLAAVIALAASAPAGAQSLTPPVPGMTANDGEVQQEGAGVETIVGKAAEGVGHVFGFTKHLFVHGRSSKGGETRPTAQRGGNELQGGIGGDGSSATAAPPQTTN